MRPDTDPELRPPPAADTHVSRLEFGVRWYALPRALVVEVEHKNIAEEELQTAMDKMDKIIRGNDLATYCDEASLSGVCRFFARRMDKLLHGDAVSVTVLWKPEMCSFLVADVTKS